MNQKVIILLISIICLCLISITIPNVKIWKEGNLIVYDVNRHKIINRDGHSVPYFK